MGVVSCMWNTGNLVCAEKSDVGTAQTSIPAADSTGMAMPSEHLP